LKEKGKWGHISLPGEREREKERERKIERGRESEMKRAWGNKRQKEKTV
jgi:hypothetical protein